MTATVPQRTTVLDVPSIESSPPAYQQIAEHYRQQIRSGALTPGEVVVSTRKMADVWDVTVKVAFQALALLRDEGWIVTRPGKPAVVVGVPKDKP